MKKQGYLAMILHAHLPYVRHIDREDCLEEKWLFEAITESYLPLLLLFYRLEREQIPCRLTMSITPTLGSMLRDQVLMERYHRHLGRLIELSEREMERTRWEPQFYSLAQMYFKLFSECRRFLNEQCYGDIIGSFRHFQERGLVEIIASAATHGFLPLMENQQSIAAQIDVGVECYREWFGRDPRGFWLPECGYDPRVEEALRRQGIRYVITDTHGVLHSRPKPRYAVYAPVYSPSGLAFFGRDQESSKQVWSSTEGYPGDFNYRDFYRDIGYDCDYEYIKPYLPDGVRSHTGIKYYRITGKEVEKQPYIPESAAQMARVHADNFFFNREKQVEYLSQHMDRVPVITAPYDAELFGHWWFEGPQWLEHLVRKIAQQETLEMISPGDYLEIYPCNQVVQPSMSTWGYQGYNEVWLNETNDWIYPHLSALARYMEELAYAEVSDDLLRRALNQCARELLLAQSSDWAFIMKAGTMVSYAVWRTKTHIRRFLELKEQIINGHVDQDYLTKVEEEDNIFPNIDYRVYRSQYVREGVS